VVTSVCAVDKFIGSACRERGLWRSFTQLAVTKVGDAVSFIISAISVGLKRVLEKRIKQAKMKT
jgi:hypothetical protein